MTKRQDKLGEILVGRGLLSQSDLVRALSNQMVYGGRIGTNLVELEMVGINPVGEALAFQWGVEPADFELLGGVDEEAVGLLTVELAQAHLAVSVRRDEQGCKVVMAEPSDLNIAAVQQAAGCDVRAYVAPELRVLYLLERWYGLQRPKRFLRVPDGGERMRERRRYLAPSFDSPPQTDGIPEAPEAVPGAQADVDVVPLQTGAEYPAVAGGTQPAAGPEDVEDTQPIDVESALRGVVTAEADMGFRPVDVVLDHIESVASGGELARLLVEPLANEATVNVMFWVRGQMAIGCVAYGVPATLQDLQQLVVPLETPSLLQWAYRLQGVARSRGKSDAVHDMIAAYLGTPSPTDICVAPVLLDGRVVNLISVQAHGGRFSPNIVADFRRVAKSARSAYERIRQGIRQ